MDLISAVLHCPTTDILFCSHFSCITDSHVYVRCENTAVQQAPGTQDNNGIIVFISIFLTNAKIIIMY